MTPSLFFTLSHLPICICLYLLVWYWNCNVSVTGAILLLRVRLHLIHWCSCPALVFPAVSSNTDKNGFNSASGTAVSTLTLQMLMIAVAYTYRLNPHSVIPLVCIFMFVSLSPQCFTLPESWDYILFRGEQKDIPCLSGMHSLKRHISPDQDTLQKWHS